MDRNDYIFGIRPVIEAIEAGRDIDKIFVSKELHSDVARELLDKAREMHVLVQRVPPEKIQRITRKQTQGVLAILSAVTYHRLDHLVPELYEAGLMPFVLILDGITDVRNFGAIARTAECAGVDAVQFLKDNGYRVVAVSEKADINYTEANFTDPVALVMGAEDVGISPDVYELCDLRVGIPMFGKIGSLNVSVAAGVLMYEVVRQRLAANLEVI